MNKIKVLYEVFKTLKEKDVFKGELKLEAEKDKASVLDFSKEFEVDISKGEGKLKVSLAADCCGHKAKHEGSTEFSFKDCCGHKDILKKIHGHCGTKCGGVKGCVDRITFALNLLNNINLEEKEDKAVLTLDLKKVCGEICQDGCKASCCGEIEKHCPCDCCKEFLHCSYDSAVLTILINKNKEIEKVEVAANASDRRVKAQLNLNW